MRRHVGKDGQDATSTALTHIKSIYETPFLDPKTIQGDTQKNFASASDAVNYSFCATHRNLQMFTFGSVKEATWLLWFNSAAYSSHPNHNAHLR
jgi:hypothetical protein